MKKHVFYWFLENCCEFYLFLARGVWCNCLKGIGICEEKQKDIFKAYTQAELDTSATFGGTGLGLTISKKFISLMGGDLELESKS